MLRNCRFSTRNFDIKNGRLVRDDPGSAFGAELVPKVISSTCARASWPEREVSADLDMLQAAAASSEGKIRKELSEFRAGKNGGGAQVPNGLHEMIV